MTAAFNGMTSVQAAAGGKSGAIAVTVAQVVASVAVSGTATLASLGETTQLSAVARDARGHLAPVTGFTWRSTAPSVATVDAGTGLASAVGNGSTLAIASAAGVESRATR